MTHCVAFRIPLGTPADKRMWLLTIRAVVFLSVWTWTALAATAADWPQFRGPGGSGMAEETGLPTEWDATKNVRWKADLPGRGLSNPVIAAGRVFVTACSGFEQRRLHLLCFDLKSGKLLWERQFWATGHSQCHEKTNMAAPTPVTDGKRVFALFATADLACLDIDGKLLWYRSFTSDYGTIANNVGMAASPVLVGDTLIVPMENVNDSFVAGINVADGTNRWRAKRGRDINWVTPFVSRRGDRAEVLVQSPKELTAYDPLKGNVLWNINNLRFDPIQSPVVAADGTVLAPTKDEVVALRPDDQGVFQVAWRNKRLRASYSTPLCVRDRAYQVSGVGIVTCVNLADGKQLGESERLAGKFAASLVAADGKLFAVNEEGTTYVLELADSPKLLAANKLEDVILATPAFADGAIFLRSDKTLYCIGQR